MSVTDGAGGSAQLQESQRETRTQLAKLQRSQQARVFTRACLHSAVSWFLSLLPGRAGRPHRVAMVADQALLSDQSSAVWEEEAAKQRCTAGPVLHPALLPKALFGLRDDSPHLFSAV